MKQCETCSNTFRSDYRHSRCKQCRSVCKCGGKKDWRIEMCRSCRSKQMASDQWANPKSRAVIHDSIKRASKERRRKFADLTFDSFRQKRLEDGRRYCWFWDANETKRTLYRYQWVWIVANGPIPDGHHIHHINENCTDDRIENLQCLSRTAHIATHMDDDHKVAMLLGRGLYRTGKTVYVCQTCGSEFKAYPRYPNGRKFCSKSCYSRNQLCQT